MLQNTFTSGALPPTPLGEFTSLSQTSYLDLAEGKEWGREGGKWQGDKGQGREGKRRWWKGRERRG